MGKWIILGGLAIALLVDGVFGFQTDSSGRHWIAVGLAVVIMVLMAAVIVWIVEGPEEYRENSDRKKGAKLDARNMQQQRFENPTANKMSHLLWPERISIWELPDHGHATTNMPADQLSHARQAPGPSDGDADYEGGSYGVWDWSTGKPRLVTPPKPKAARGESQ